MCDYSLKNVQARDAVKADRLVTTRFKGTTSLGFAGHDDPNVAVCLLPGTEIAFKKTPETSAYHFMDPRRLFERSLPLEAIFRQVNLDNPDVHHDALEFSNGQIVSLQNLRSDQAVTVISLPAAPRTTVEAQAQQRLPVTA